METMRNLTVFVGVFMVFTLAYIGSTQAVLWYEPVEEAGVGYEYLDGGAVLHLWNKHNNYYINVSSGIQLTNYYDDYWTHNIFCLGYKTTSWNYNCVDSLPIEIVPYSDDSTYVHLVGNRTIEIAGRTIVMGIEYYLGEYDGEIRINPYVKNLGADITNDIGFAWKTNEIMIDGTVADDRVYINGTWYDLSDSLDVLFTQDTLNETFGKKYTLWDKSWLHLRWTAPNYFVQIKEQAGQYNAPVTVAVTTTGLNYNQKKTTYFYWQDPLWSDPAGDQQGWYNVPNEFHVYPEMENDETVDDKWDNRSSGDVPGGQYAYCKGQSGAEHCNGYFWLDGFSEGTYTLIITGQGGGSGLYNVTIEAPNSDSVWYNTTAYNVAGGYQLNGNWTAYPIEVYVNATGIFNVRMISDENNDNEAGSSKLISAWNITNYTETGEGGDTTPPSLMDFIAPTLANATLTNNNWIEINATLTDDNSSACLLEYSNKSVKTNYTMPMMNMSGDTHYCFLNLSESGKGLFNYSVWAWDGVGNYNVTDLRSVNANYTVWGTPPYWTTFQPPNLSADIYSPSPWNMEFNVTWVDADNSIDTAYLYHDVGQNWNYLKLSNTTPTEYFYTLTKSVKAGTYTYMYWANDTLGNSNTTGNLTFTINKATPVIDLLLNGTESSQTFIYGNWSNVTATSPNISTGLNLFRNGSLIAGGVDLTKLGAGTWNYTSNVTHENWTYKEGYEPGTKDYDIVLLTMSQQATGLSLSASPGWSVIDGDSTTVTCTNNSFTVDLYADNVVVSNPHTTVLALGTHNYTCILTGADATNYTSVVEQHDLEVSETGFGCTNETTFAFKKEATNVPPNFISYDFSDLVDIGAVKSDLSDVYTDDSNITLMLNMTDGEHLVVNLTADDGNFTIYFGNYFANYSYDMYSVTHNDTNMSGYATINPYYTISMLNEISGSSLNPSNSTKYLRIFCTGGSSYVPLDNTTTRFVVSTSEQPDSLVFHVSYSASEYYWRELLPTTTVELIEFYLVDANSYQVAEMKLDVIDYSGSYGQGDVLRVKKWLQGSLKTVTESELDVETKILAYLMTGEKYALYLDNNVLETSIGNMLVETSDLTKTIIIGSFPLTNEQYGNIQWNLTMDNTTGAIQFFLFDPTNQTTNVTMEVYNYSNQSQLLYYTYSENRSAVNFNYVVPDINQSYKIHIHAAHDFFGEDSLMDIWRVFTGLATAIALPYATIPVGIMTGMVVISIISIALTFGSRQGAFGGIMVGLMILLYTFWGFYVIPVGIGVLVIFLAVLNKFREAKRQ